MLYYVSSLACNMIRFPQVFCLEYAGIEPGHFNRRNYNAVLCIIKLSTRKLEVCTFASKLSVIIKQLLYEGWNFNSGNYLFTTDTK